MGPVSAFGFSVCGWGAIRGAGLEGRRATAAAAPRALRWGWGHAGQQQQGAGSHECRQGITGRQHGGHG